MRWCASNPPDSENDLVAEEGATMIFPSEWVSLAPLSAMEFNVVVIFAVHLMSFCFSHGPSNIELNKPFGILRTNIPSRTEHPFSSTEAIVILTESKGVKS